MNRMNMQRRSVLAGLMLAGALAGLPALAQDKPLIKLGFIGPISGGNAAQGLGAKNGFLLAIEQANAGDYPYTVEPVVLDDASDPQTGVAAALKLVNDPEVVAAIGHWNSPVALATMPVFNRFQMPMIVWGAISPKITEQNLPEITRVTPTLVTENKPLAEWAASGLGAKKIAIIADTTGYGQAATKDLQEILPLHGITPVGIEKFGPKDTDMTSQLAKLKAAGADMIISGSLADATAQVLKSMEKMDYYPGLLSTWGSINSPLINIAGAKLAEKTVFAASTTADANPKAKALSARLLAKYPNMPAFVSAAQGYDSVMLIAAAIAKANSTDGEKVAAALEDLGAVEGIIKTYNKPFSKTNHEALGVADFHLAQWKDGQVVKVDNAIVKSMTAADLKR